MLCISSSFCVLRAPDSWQNTSFEPFSTFFVVWTFLLDFRREITEKGFKLTKKVENSPKKYFEQLSGARSTQKLVKIHNKKIVHLS